MTAIPDSGVVGLVGFGGCRADDGRAEIASRQAAGPSALGSPLALASAARGVLETLQGSGFSFNLDVNGALLVSPASALRDDQREAIRTHRIGLGLLVLLRDEADMSDERRRCEDCSNLQANGRYSAAAAGLIPGAPHDYSPAPAVLQRCAFFRAYWLKELA